MKNDYDKFFMLFIQQKPNLEKYENETETKLYLVDKVAELTISAGLVEWVIKRHHKKPNRKQQV
ncbi:MAG: hypothetical protein IPP52_07395 [Ignavibacteria bacterium]|nr:hypothetical protein [Ignavibacteria bacterium]